MLSLFATLLVSVLAPAAGQTQIPYSSTRDVGGVPEWIYAPQNIRLVQPEGAKLELVGMAMSSSEYHKEAVLLGRFRNRGRALKGVEIRLSYLRAGSDAVLRTVTHATWVTDVQPEGLLPFRLPLLPRASLPDGAFAFRIEVEEQPQAARRAIAASVSKFRVRAQGERGAVVMADVQLTEAGSFEGPTVTLVLLDKDGNLLDVLSGTASVTQAPAYRVELRTLFPIGSRIKQVRAYAEVP